MYSFDSIRSGIVIKHLSPGIDVSLIGRHCRKLNIAYG